MTKNKTILYIKVLNITHKYFGPSADRFIAKQITEHLNKDPEQLAESDLTELIDWIEIAMAFLTDDHRLIKNYINSLQTLTKHTRH
jgi:hypothetical protein